MAQDLTASVLNAVQEKIENVFQGDTPNKYDYKEPGHVIGGLFERNSAQLNPLVESGGLVRGYDVHYLKPGADTITQNGAPSTVAAALACDIGTGEFPESDNISLTHNKMISSVVSVNDNLVTSMYNAAPTAIQGVDRAAVLIAERIKKGMRDQRVKLDEWGIDFLHANRSPVNDALTTPAKITFDGTNKIFNADAPHFQDPNFLTDINALAANNNMDDYFMVSGLRNFYNAVTDARYVQLNDNERFVTRFATADIYFDIRRMDSRLDSGATGAGYTFVVGDGTYAAWNYADVKPNAVMIDEDKYVMTLPDPVLSVNFNGSLSPVYYEVVVQKVCTGRDSLGRHVYNHNIELRFLGALHAAPAAATTNTGILEMVSTPGI